MKKTVFALLACLAIPFTVHAGPIRDITILMDSSGSVGSSGWAIQKDFVEELIANVIPEYNSNFSVVSFSTGATVEHEFYDDQDNSAIISNVNSLPWTAGYTHTKDAIIEAINGYQNYSLSLERTIIMITDGNPVPASSQNPCSLKPYLDAEDIGMFIFGVGSNLNFNTIDCLVDDPVTQMVEVTDFSFGSFDATVNSFTGYMGIADGSVYQTQSACEATGATWSNGSCGSIWIEDIPTSSVPEPPSWMLLSAALLGLARIRRKQDGQLRDGQRRSCLR